MTPSLTDVHLMMALALCDGAASLLKSKAVSERRRVRATLVVDAAVEALVRTPIAIKSVDELLAYIDVQVASDPIAIRTLIHDLSIFVGNMVKDDDTMVAHTLDVLWTLGFDQGDIWPTQSNLTPPVIVFAHSVNTFPPQAISQGGVEYRLVAAMITSNEASFFGTTWRGRRLVFRGTKKGLRDTHDNASIVISKHERVQAFRRWKGLWDVDRQTLHKKPCASYALSRDWVRELEDVGRFCMSTCGRVTPSTECPSDAPQFTAGDLRNVYVYATTRGAASGDLPTLTDLMSPPPTRGASTKSASTTGASAKSASTTGASAKSASAKSASAKSASAKSASAKSASARSRAANIRDTTSRGYTYGTTRTPSSVRTDSNYDTKGELFQCQLKVADLEHRLSQQYAEQFAHLAEKLPQPQWR